jgi:uncharacterized protein
VGTTVIIVSVLSFVGLALLFQIIGLKVARPIFERKPPFAVEQFPADPTAESMTIPTTYGLRLQASLFRPFQGTPRGLIIFCPEFNSDRWSAASYCQGLLASGFHVLAFDFRNQGDSDHLPDYDPLHWLTGFEVDDVLSVVDFVESHPDLRELPLGIFGVSRGGGAALVAAGSCDSIKCVATDGAYSCNELMQHFAGRWAELAFPEPILKRLPRWHVVSNLSLVRFISGFMRGCKYANIERALTKLRDKPVFMISGGRDTYVTPAITEKLYSRTGRKGPGVWIVPNAKHNMARQTLPDEYDRRIAEFFSNLSSALPLPTRPLAESPRAPAPLAAARTLQSTSGSAG